MVCSMISSKLSSAFILPVEAEHPQHSSPAEEINLTIESRSLIVEVLIRNNLTLESYCSLSSRRKKSLQP